MTTGRSAVHARAERTSGVAKERIDRTGRAPSEVAGSSRQSSRVTNPIQTVSQRIPPVRPQATACALGDAKTLIATQVITRGPVAPAGVAPSPRQIARYS